MLGAYALLLLGDVAFWNVFGFDRSAAQAYFIAPVRLSSVLVSKNLAALASTRPGDCDAGDDSASLAEMGYRVSCFCIQDSPRRAHSIAAQGGINAAKNYRNDGDSVQRLVNGTPRHSRYGNSAAPGGFAPTYLDRPGLDLDEVAIGETTTAKPHFAGLVPRMTLDIGV